MARAELTGELAVARQWQEAPGGHHAIITDERGAVVQRRVRQEQAREQVGRYERVQRDAELRILPQSRPALDRDERADAPLGERAGHRGDLVDHAQRFRPGATEQRMQRARVAERGEGTPQLGLEEHDQDDDPERPQRVEEPAEAVQLELARGHRCRDEDADADEHLHRARPAKQREDAIDHERDEQDVDRVAPAERARRHRAALRTRSATRTASTVSGTSWVRMSAAPPSTAAVVAASEPGRRAAESSRPVMAPTNDLRETPTQSGRPRAASAGNPASTATSHACQAMPVSRKKPMPGSRTIRCVGIPAACAVASAVASSRVTVATGSSMTRPGPGAAITMSPASCAAATRASAGSASVETSFTTRAPASSAARATAGRHVSTEIGAGSFAASALTARTSRSVSSASLIAVSS